MKKLLLLGIITLILSSCKAPEIKELKAPEYSSILTLDKKFSLTDPMVHVGLQTAIITNDGTVLANENENIKVWNYDTKTLLQTLKGHQKLVIDMVLSPDESKLFSAGLEEGDILVWDWKQGTLLKRLQGHSAQVNCMRISADGKFLATVSTDGTIKIWDAQNLNLLRTINGIEQNVNTKVTICNDAKYVAVLQSKSFVVFDGKTGSEYWRKVDENNYQSPQLSAIESTFMNFIAEYDDILLNSDGSQLFFNNVYLGSWDITNKLYYKTLLKTANEISGSGLPGGNLNSNQLINSNIEKITKKKPATNIENLKSLFFCANENRLIFEYGIYDFRNNFNAYQAPKSVFLLSNFDNSKLLIFNAFGFQRINWSSTMSSSSAFSGGFLGDWVNKSSDFKIDALSETNAISSDSKQLYVSTINQLYGAYYIPSASSLYASTNNTKSKALNLKCTNVRFLLSESNMVRLFDNDGGQLIKEIQLSNGFISSPTFSHDEQYFYVDSKLFKASDGSKLLNFPIIEGFVIFTSNDGKLVNLNSKGEIKEFDVNTGKEVRSFLTVANDDYMRLAISGDDKEIAIATSKEILIYNLTEGKLLGSFPVNPIFTLSNTIAYNPQQKVIAVATLDRKVQLWTTTARQLISEQSFDFDIVHLQFNEDGKVLNVVTLKDYYRYKIN